MALMRFDPFREVDRWFDGPGPVARAVRVMPMEAYRRGDRFDVHFDVPGVDPDAVHLTVERNVVTVRAERRTPTQNGDDVLVAERPAGCSAGSCSSTTSTPRTSTRPTTWRAHPRHPGRRGREAAPGGDLGGLRVAPCGRAGGRGVVRRRRKRDGARADQPATAAS